MDSFFKLGAGWGGWSTPRSGRFNPGKETRYQLHRRRCGPQGRSGRVQKISLPPGFDPRTVQPVVSRYTGPLLFRDVCFIMYDKTLLKKKVPWSSTSFWLESLWSYADLLIYFFLCCVEQQNLQGYHINTRLIFLPVVQVLWRRLKWFCHYRSSALHCWFRIIRSVFTTCFFDFIHSFKKGKSSHSGSNVS
jgi:hypothetical protein